MDRDEQDQRDGEVLPAEEGQDGDHSVAAPALADDVLPDTLVLLPCRAARRWPRAAGRSGAGRGSLRGSAGSRRTTR